MVTLVPVSGLDPAQHELFDAWAAVFADVAEHEEGEDHDAWSAAELRQLEKRPTARRRAVLALDGDTAVGAAGSILPLRDNTHLAMGSLAVVPECRRGGIGRQLLDWLESEARDDGRSTLIGSTTWGAGREESAARLLTASGYRPVQTSLRSDQPLPVDATRLESWFRVPEAYAVQTALDGIPDGWLEDQALLQRRMSTDSPLGETDHGEEEWDADRLRQNVESVRAMGRQLVEAVVRHRESGRLVAFTRLEVPGVTPHLAYQQDTLVLREHRGHALGLAVKAASVTVLERELPQVRRIRTWNAEENAHMRAVNALLGYRTTGYLREWQKSIR